MKQDIATILSYYTGNASRDSATRYIYTVNIILDKFGNELEHILNHTMRKNYIFHLLFYIYSGYKPLSKYCITKIITYKRLYYCYIDKYPNYKIVIYRDVIYMINKGTGLYLRLYNNEISYIQNTETFTSIANIKLCRWQLKYYDVSVKYRDGSIELYEIIDKSTDTKIFYNTNSKIDKIIIYMGTIENNIRQICNYYKNRDEGIHRYLLNGEYINLPL